MTQRTLNVGSFLPALWAALSFSFLSLPVSAADVRPAQVVASPVSKEMRCPVCGMYPARYPKWMVQVVYHDRQRVAFDSPADFFRFRQNFAQYAAGRQASDISAVYFSDFMKTGWIESKTVFLVSGSSARGPMNNADFPAFASREAAEQFVKEQGGQVLAYAQITPDTLKALFSGSAHEHSAHDHGPAQYKH